MAVFSYMNAFDKQGKRFVQVNRTQHTLVHDTGRYYVYRTAKIIGRKTKYTYTIAKRISDFNAYGYAQIEIIEVRNPELRRGYAMDDMIEKANEYDKSRLTE